MMKPFVNTVATNSRTAICQTLFMRRPPLRRRAGRVALVAGDDRDEHVLEACGRLSSMRATGTAASTLCMARAASTPSRSATS